MNRIHKYNIFTVFIIYCTVAGFFVKVLIKSICLSKLYILFDHYCKTSFFLCSTYNLTIYPVLIFLYILIGISSPLLIDYSFKQILNFIPYMKRNVFDHFNSPRSVLSLLLTTHRIDIPFNTGSI